MAAPALLELDRVAAAYGGRRALFEVGFTIGEGEAVALLGRNGMGKTTTVRAILGLVNVIGGDIRIGGRRVVGMPPHRIARLGIGLVPEGRQTFPTLTVRENLIATAREGDASGWTVDRVYALFPPLAARVHRLARSLSGGEQQMLAIGRALMTSPRLLILDEATEGLAPLVRRDIWRALAMLKAAGLALLVIDKGLQALLSLADRAVILEKGRVAWQGKAAELTAAPEIAHRLLGV